MTLLNKDEREALNHFAITDGLSAQIRALRASRCWTQREMGSACGVNQSTVSAWERGHPPVRIETLLRIAAVFDVGIEIRFVAWSKFLFTPQGFFIVPWEHDEAI